MPKITFKTLFFRILTKFIFLTLGPFIAAYALECFLVPNNIIDGGIIGLGIILSHIINYNLGLLIFILNFPFILLAFNKIGKKFVLQTFYAIAVLAVSVNFFHHFEVVTGDLLLATVFGGIVLGIGVGLVLKNDGSMDGTEIMSLVLSKKFGFSVGEMIMGFNILIYTAAGFVFGPEKAMYAVITYFIASRIIDIVLEGFNTSKSVRIISDCGNEIGQALLERLNVGVTYLDGKGGFSGKDKTLIYCVVARLELAKLKEIVKEIDPCAFLSVVDVHETFGGRIKKR